MNEAPPDDTRLVFLDLLESKRALDEARGSPCNVRRAFSRFVDLTQRLTSTMRKDYPRLTNKKWDAKAFNGWTIDTQFLKWLRNEDQHATQIYISVHQRDFYSIDDAGDQQLVFEGTWVLTDQLAAEVPTGITFNFPDPVTGAVSERVVQPVYTEYQYLFQPRTDQAKEWLQKIGNSDIHLLAERSLAVLTAYHDHFRASTQQGTDPIPLG